MISDNLKELYGKKMKTEEIRITEEIYLTIIAFLVGLTIFPLGLALGFHLKEERKFQCYAAFLGVFIILLSGTLYLILNWYEIFETMRKGIPGI